MNQTPDEKVAAFESVLDDLEDADSLKDTPFSELFHEARTANQRRYNGATADYNFKLVDGDVVLTQIKLVKTRQGEHWQPEYSPDISMGLVTEAFMTTERAKERLTHQLKYKIDQLKP